MILISRRGLDSYQLFQVEREWIAGEMVERHDDFGYVRLERDGEWRAWVPRWEEQRREWELIEKTFATRRAAERFLVTRRSRMD